MNISSINSTGSSPVITERVNNKSSAPVTASSSTEVSNESAKAAKAYTRDQLDQAVSTINKTMQATSQNLEFSVDNDTRDVVVKVIDQQTKQVLRQIPSEEAIEISKSIDKLQGLLIKQTA
jgi:flagellar protein FlaG